MIVIAYISMGANIGNREYTIQASLDLLSSDDMVTLKKVSSLIETTAVSTVAQPSYLNGACEIETLLSPDELLTLTQSIEKQLGRTSKGTGDPRPIDLDILLYGDQLVSEDHLVVPHPLMHERYFVLKPLAEIAPDVTHPMLQCSVEELLQDYQQ